MKSLNKLFLALLATLAVGFVSMGFVACSDDDDEESALFDLRKEVSGTKVATYVGSYTKHNGEITKTITIIFYTDNTQNLYQIDEQEQYGNEVSYYTSEEGTYEGDLSKDGTITLTITTGYSPSEDYSKLEAENVTGNVTRTLIIKDGKATSEDWKKVESFSKQ